MAADRPLVRRRAAVPTPEQLLLALARLYEDDPDEIGEDLAHVASLDRHAAGGPLGPPPAWSAEMRDRTIRHLLDRVAPQYTTGGGAA